MLTYKNSKKFTGKLLQWSSLFSKGYFPVNFTKVFRTAILQKTFKLTFFLLSSITLLSFNYFLLAFLWVTLNRFNALLFWCFHCWLWASKCWLGCGTLVQFCPPNLLLKNDIYQIWCTTLLTLIIVLNTQVLFYLLQSITCSKTTLICLML